MDPITIATIAIGMISAAMQARDKFLPNSPAWAKYVEAGLYVSQQALTIIAAMRDRAAEYDTLTPAQVRALLTPPTWGELELEVDAEGPSD